MNPLYLLLVAAIILVTAACGGGGPDAEPCAEGRRMFEFGGHWYVEDIVDGSDVFGPGTEADAAAVCSGR